MFKMKLLSALIATTALSAGEFVWAAPGDAEASAGKGLEEVIVSARRTEENLQDIPVAVKVISGDELQSMAMTSPTELSKLSPGLSLSLSDPKTPIIILRGVRWTAGSGSPAIPIYFNEIGFGPEVTLLSMFDIGQVEVVRGPQGTSRGAPSISGAVTMSTRAPNTHEAGGYVSGLAGTDDHRNLQGAFGFPIIEDKLAVRFAALAEDNQTNHVTSVNSAATRDPFFKSRVARVSFVFEPTDTFTLNTMYQRQQINSAYYNQVVGAGSPGGLQSAVAASGLGYFAGGANVAKNYNGPAISLSDYRSVQETPTINDQTADLFTLNTTWEVLGHALDYNFGYQKSRAISYGSYDIGNQVQGFNAPLTSDSRASMAKNATQELRLSSLRTEDHLIDYDVGAYWHYEETDPFAVNAVAGLSTGALGDPRFAPVPTVTPASLARYGVPSLTTIGISKENYSFYGDMVIHLPDETELTLGARRLREDQSNYTKTTINPYYAGLNAALFGGACGPAGTVASPVYGPGVCDLTRTKTQPDDNASSREFASIYNISLSHKFTDDVLGYGTVGSSWRGGLPALNNPGLSPNLLNPAPEKATSFELGVKSKLGRDIRLNADIFHVIYKDQLTQFQYIPYYNSQTGQPSPTSVAFYSNVDSEVNGAEVEFDIAPIDGLVLGANLSYAAIKASGGQIPCSNNAVALSSANPINLCAIKKGSTLNSSPQFQANLTGSYTMPLGAYDGYARLVTNFQGKNPNFNSTQATSSYALVDLFVGVTGDQGAWNLGLYSKNLFDRQVQLTTNDIVTGAGLDQLFGPTGYSNVTATLPREVGISARYAFGSK